MRSLFVLTASVFLVSFSSFAESRITRRIYGGISLNSVGVPIVAVTNGNSLCSGVVISQNSVLTAAHCSEGLTRFAVISGGNRAIGATRRGTVGKLMVLRTDTNLPSNIRPITLSSVAPRTGSKIYIYGFGQNELGKPNLRGGVMLTAGLSRDYLAAVYVPGGSNVCNGDSGGPAIYNGRVVGLTEMGTTPCTSYGAQSYFSRTDLASVRNAVMNLTR